MSCPDDALTRYRIACHVVASMLGPRDSYAQLPNNLRLPTRRVQASPTNTHVLAELHFPPAGFSVRAAGVSGLLIALACGLVDGPKKIQELVGATKMISTR